MASAALAGPAAASRRAWHLAGATIGPDERVAGQLEQAALDARRRGVPTAARRALETAARLTPRPKPAGHAPLLAAESFNAAGRAEQGQPLFEEALELTDDPILVAQIEDGRARAAIMREPPRAVRERLLAAAERVEPSARGHAANR